MEKVKKLENFINGIGAVRKLLEVAHSNGSLIEALVLYASIVDGFCRIALLLNEQMENRTSEINEKYIYQDESDKSYLKDFSERKIYEKAHDNKIIERDLYDDLCILYDIRNKAIHRFLISNFKYSHLEIVLEKYELVYQRLYTIVYNLESEQIYKNVGMTVAGESSELNESDIMKTIFSKIKDDDIESLKKTLGPKFTKNSQTFSEDTERDNLHKNIYDELEIQKEKKNIPPGFKSVKEITKWAERKGFLKNCICGHPKILHINLNELKSDNELIPNPKSCNEDKCNCDKYIEKE